MSYNIYKISLRNQFHFLWQALLLMLFTFSFTLFLSDSLTVIIGTTAFIFLLDTLPTLIVHVQYLANNWHATLTIDRNQNKISYSTKEFEKQYSFESIEKITRLSCYNQSAPSHSFGDYFYYKIFLKDENPLIITCLLADDLEIYQSIIFPTFEKKKKIIPLIN